MSFNKNKLFLYLAMALVILLILSMVGRDILKASRNIFTWIAFAGYCLILIKMKVKTWQLYVIGAPVIILIFSALVRYMRFLKFGSIILLLIGLIFGAIYLNQKLSKNKE